MDDAQQHRSHLFTVRLWLEPVSDGEGEVRGHVRHLLSGETHYFRTYSGLAKRMAVYLDPVDPQHTS